MSTFEGFPTKTTTFLRDLAKNNEKPWFDAHRAEYEAHWLEPAKAFVEAAGAALSKIAPAIEAEPRVNGSIFRINRDVRFSADKRPYKDHLDFWFWEGERKSAVSGFFLRITPRQVGVGVGAHGFDKDRLAAFRNAVADPAQRRKLETAVKKVEKAGYEVEGEHYKKVPAGFEVEGAMGERLIRHNALWVGEDVRQPPELRTPGFVGWAMSHWKKQAPLHRWLVDAL